MTYSFISDPVTPNYCQNHKAFPRRIKISMAIRQQIVQGRYYCDTSKTRVLILVKLRRALERDITA